MFVEDIQTVLAANTSLQSELGTTSTPSNGGNGLYPVQAPDECPAPYIVLEQVGSDSLQTSFQGTGRLQSNRWRFSCYGSSYKSAKKLTKVLTGILLSLIGTLGSTTELHGSWQVSEIDSSEPLARGTLYGTHVDFQFVFLDTEP